MKEYVAIILTGCILFASVFVSANFELKEEELVSSLPYDDQDKLKEGIEVNGDTSLRKCLEDFCS